MLGVFALTTAWILIGLFINIWWPQWTTFYVIGAGLLAIPMVIAHSDILIDALFKPTPEKPTVVPEPQQEADLTAIVREAYGPLDKLIKDHPIGQHIQKVILALALQEDFTTETPRPVGETPGLTKRFFFVQEMPAMFDALARRPPKMNGPSPLTASLIEFIPEPHKFLYGIYRSIFISQGNAAAGLYTKMRAVFGENLRDITLDLKDPFYPINTSLPVSQLSAYVRGTPFAQLFDTPIPLPYTYDERFSHMMISGGNKSGKTTLLKRLILHDLQQEKPPSLVILDSHNDITPWLTNLELFHPENGRLKGRLIICSHDEPPPPAINIFHQHADTHQADEDTITILKYLFKGIGIDMTGMQGGLFEPCVRFLLTFPDTLGQDAGLLDFIRLLEEPMPAEYRRAASVVPDPIIRDFMQRMFHHETYEKTKGEVLRRLNHIRTSGYVGRMLSSSETRVDLYERLNKGAVVVVNVAGAGDSIPLLGRAFVALTLKAIFARYKIPEQYRKPTFLYVDEAQYYFDEYTRKLLTEARKFKLGGVFAHHGLKDLNDDLRSYLTGETAIRMVGRPFPEELRALASVLHTDPQTLKSQPRYHFTTWIDGMKTVSATVDANEVERQPSMGDKAYKELIRRNRERISIREQPAPPPQPETAPTAEPAKEAAAQPEPLATGTPFMITQAQKEELRRRGHTDADIRQMRPEDAHRILQPEPPQPEPPKKRKRPRKRKGPLIGDIDTSA